MTELLHELKNSTCYHSSIQAFDNVSAGKKENEKFSRRLCITKKGKFSCVLYAHAQVLCSLARRDLANRVVRQPVQWHTFCARLLVFDETLAQLDFAFVNCKTLVCKHEYDIKLRRHKQRTPNTNDHWMKPPHENLLRTPLCCSYYQLQLWVGPRGMVFGEVTQSKIYAKFGESSCKKVQKTKDHTMVDWVRWRHKYNITARTRGRHFLIGPGAADCAPAPLSTRTLLARCYTMCHCNEDNLSALQVRRPEQNSTQR